MPSNNVFWMLYLEGGGAPNVRHYTKDSVKTEAERLAREFPGRRVFVLESCASVIKNDLAWETAPERASGDDIPF